MALDICRVNVRNDDGEKRARRQLCNIFFNHKFNLPRIIGITFNLDTFEVVGRWNGKKVFGCKGIYEIF